MNSVSEEAEDGSEPEQESEPSKQILAEFDPLWSLGRRSESVRTISLLRETVSRDFGQLNVPWLPDWP